MSARDYVPVDFQNEVSPAGHGPPTRREFLTRLGGGIIVFVAVGNLATAQEAFYADSSSYATTYGTTVATGQLNFAPSQKNTLTINSASNASGVACRMACPTATGDAGATSCGV